MREFLRLLRLFAPSAGWLLLGLLLTLATLATQALILGSAGAVLLGSTGLALLLRSSGALRPILRYAERLATHSATFSVLARLRLWLFARLIPLAPQQLGTRRAGDILARLLQDVDLLDGFALRLLLPLIVGTLALLILFIGIGQTGALLIFQLTLVMLALFLALVLIVQQRHKTDLEQVPIRQADLRSDVLDGCEGLADLLASDAADLQLHKITLSSANLAHSKLGQVRQRLLIQFLVSLGTGLLLMLVILALTQMPQGKLTAYELLALVLLALGLLETLPALGQALSQWPLLHSAAQRIFQLADTPCTVPEPVAAQPVPALLELSLENVGVDYGRSPLALDGVSLNLRTGSRTLIAGPSGAGKTTLLQLLLKFILPTQGRVMVGGTDLQNLDGDAWRKQVAILGQMTTLLAGTVRENLLLANPQATEAQLWQALEAAELATFVQSLPEGLESWVGEGGASFSGGQARRLALAQMLLKNAPIWLLDEPTEGLDDATARAVLTTLARLAGSRTVICITHQPELGQLIAPTQEFRLQNGKLMANTL
jgi:ATP-binding cassette, subfamily C, bacterial CydC